MYWNNSEHLTLKLKNPWIESRPAKLSIKNNQRLFERLRFNCVSSTVWKLVYFRLVLEMKAGRVETRAISEDQSQNLFPKRSFMISQLFVLFFQTTKRWEREREGGGGKEFRENKTTLTQAKEIERKRMQMVFLVNTSGSLQPWNIVSSWLVMLIWDLY